MDIIPPLPGGYYWHTGKYVSEMYIAIYKYRWWGFDKKLASSRYCVDSEDKCHLGAATHRYLCNSVAEAAREALDDAMSETYLETINMQDWIGFEEVLREMDAHRLLSDINGRSIK